MLHDDDDEKKYINKNNLIAKFNQFLINYSLFICNHATILYARVQAGDK